MAPSPSYSSALDKHEEPIQEQVTSTSNLSPKVVASKDEKKMKKKKPRTRKSLVVQQHGTGFTERTTMSPSRMLDSPTSTRSTSSLLTTTSDSYNDSPRWNWDHNQESIVGGRVKNATIGPRIRKNGNSTAAAAPPSAIDFSKVHSLQIHMGLVDQDGVEIASSVATKVPVTNIMSALTGIAADKDEELGHDNGKGNIMGYCCSHSASPSRSKKEKQQRCQNLCLKMLSNLFFFIGSVLYVRMAIMSFHYAKDNQEAYMSWIQEEENVAPASTSSMNDTSINTDMQQQTSEHATTNDSTVVNTAVDYSSFYWTDLPKEAKVAAQTLGYTKEIWNAGSEPTNIQKCPQWECLTVDQMDAATVLGYDEARWNYELLGEQQQNNDKVSSTINGLSANSITVVVKKTDDDDDDKILNDDNEQNAVEDTVINVDGHYYLVPDTTNVIEMNKETSSTPLSSSAAQQEAYYSSTGGDDDYYYYDDFQTALYVRLYICASLAFVGVGLLDWLIVGNLYPLLFIVAGIFGFVSALYVTTEPHTSNIMNVISIHLYFLEAFAILWHHGYLTSCCFGGASDPHDVHSETNQLNNDSSSSDGGSSEEEAPAAISSPASTAAMVTKKKHKNYTDMALVIADISFLIGSTIELILSYYYIFDPLVDYKISIQVSDVAAQSLWVLCSVIYMASTCKMIVSKKAYDKLGL